MIRWTLAFWTLLGAMAVAAGCNAIAGIQTGELAAGDASVDATADQQADGAGVGPGDAPADTASPPDAAHGDAGGGSDSGPSGDAGADADAEAGCAGLVCNGACVPNDVHNCGGCGHDCTALPNVSGPVSCLASGQCSFSPTSCAPGWTHCASNADLGCETDISKPANCGSCQNVCPANMPVCAGSGSTYACVSGCPAADPLLCGGTCVDPATNANDCQTCGNVCATAVSHAQPVCVNSACTFSCNSGYTACGGACVDTTSDAANCGSCGHSCGSAAYCASSTCQCNANALSCGGVCAVCNTPAHATAKCTGTTCGYTCDATYTDCGTSCVNLQGSDPANCGACGHSCLGGACVAGVCQPATVAGSLTGVTGVAVDASKVYFATNAGQIGACPLSGCTGAPQYLVTSLGSAGILVMDPARTTLFTGNRANGGLSSVSTAGTLNYTKSVGFTGALTTDGTYLYWSYNSGGPTSTYPLGMSRSLVGDASGASSWGFTSQTTSVDALWYDATSNDVYAAFPVNQGAIYQCSLSGSCLDTAGLNGVTYSYASTVVVQGATAYFGAAGAVAGYTDGGVFSAPVSSLTTVTALATGSTYASPTALAADASNVYFATGASLYACALGGCGGAPKAIAPGSASQIVTDAQAIYWSTDTAVMKLAK